MDFCDCALCVQHALEAEKHGLRVLKGRHRISGTVESLVCLHWLEEDFYDGAGGLNTNAGWQEGGLPASLMIKGGCDALTQATNLP